MFGVEKGPEREKAEAGVVWLAVCPFLLRWQRKFLKQGGYVGSGQ